MHTHPVELVIITIFDTENTESEGYKLLYYPAGSISVSDQKGHANKRKKRGYGTDTFAWKPIFPSSAS